MTKKLLAAAIATAVIAAPAAYADAVIYGKLHQSIDNVDNGSDDHWQMTSRASRLGFKGSEDLGNGLKAVYKAEFTVELDGNETSGPAGQDAGDGWGGQRNTFIGLAGDFGTFVVGRHDTPAKMAFYAQGNDRLGDSIIDINGGMLGGFTEVRADNAIAYVSPKFAGLTVAAAVVPGEGMDAGGTADGLADHYSVGVMYKNGGIKAGLGYEVLDLAANSDEKEMLQVGASYTFGAFSIGASYQDTDNASSRGFTAYEEGAEYQAFAVTGKATFGNNAFSLVYLDTEGENAAGSTVRDTTGWGLAAEHNFSKRTKVYAAYATADDDETDAEDDRFSLGMVHSF